MLYLFLILLSMFGATDNFEIPSDAKSCAQKYFEIDWKAEASRNPHVYNAHDTEIDPSYATLGKGYHHFIISADSTRSYVLSDVLDPRGFASKHAICFPVLAESTIIALVKVIELDEAHKDLEVACGKYDVSWAIGRYMKQYYGFQSVPQEYGLSDATLSVITFYTPTGETWHMFPTPTGAHIVFYRHAEHFLDRTAVRFKRELKRRWEEEGN